ncbi:GerAB/ArcD/ProY family transporter [Bacillus sp. JJ664]
MNSNPVDRISTYQVVMFLANFILGAGILTLPRTLTEKVGTPDAWIGIILSGLFIILIAILIVRLCKKFPNETFYQFSQKLVGKWVGIIISLIIIIYYICLSAFEVRSMAETTMLYLLQGTPTWAVMMPFLWIGLYLVIGGINSIARMLEIIFPITVLCFLLVIFLGIGIFEIDNLRPVLGMGIKPVLKGLTTTSLSFAGFEIMLVIFMFMKEKKNASKAAIFGIGIPLVFYTITVISVVGSFSVSGVVSQTWPVLTFVRSYEITGLFFERFDSILLVIWIMQIFATFIVSFFAAAIGMAQIFNKKSFHPFLFIIIPFIYLIAMIPEDINGVFKMGGLLGNFSFYTFGALTIVLLFVSFVKEKVNGKM